MRAQRAPHASAQPQQPPAGWQPSRAAAAPASATTLLAAPSAGPRFVADVDLDVSGARRDAGGEDDLTAEIVVCLLAACRAHGLVDDGTSLQVLSPAADGWHGVSYRQAARQSAFGIARGLAEMAPVALDQDPGTLRLVRLEGSGVRCATDWGLPGLATITVGAPAPVATPWVQQDAGGLSIVTRWLVRVSLATPPGAETARAAVSALAATERALAEPGARA
ncbi:hypothetical protein LRP67_06120 [Nocardioides sp. cx-169]|uniref:hypothetical protein n=1 Tax=Nocardioides sp. cx-169 TaxID=2899080 RepID=UPI001E2B83B8|nr:hypothetical protein [Nocardioides sp. cx-169]MCD4533653.1 hypothetical protein [Nocardioides sp. cx-169]